MDIKIWSVFISATIALITFLILHFFIDPMKEKREGNWNNIRISMRLYTLLF